jgi:hypothetical protein
MSPTNFGDWTAEGLDALRHALGRAQCRVRGHRWVLATLDPVLMRPFNVCVRCGQIWSGQ